MVGWLKKLWYERRPVVIAAAVLIIGLPAVLIVAPDKDKRAISPVVSTAAKQAQAATESGDYTGAYNRLKAAESDWQTTEDKVELYAHLAAAAANVGKTEEAINYLVQKHGLDPATAQADAFMLARLYERDGNRDDALSQYRLALEFYQQHPGEDPVTAKSMVATIQATIAELEANNE